MTSSLVVFAPSPLLTITVEPTGGAHEEIHLHAGGQGFWVARMASLLGARVGLCCCLGGESGAVLRGLVEREKVQLLPVECAAANGSYLHMRRDGVREQVARSDSQRLSRHEADELYGVTLTAALDAQLTMLTGTDPPEILEGDFYRRLAADLRSNGITVIADLSGEPLRAALEGGVDLLKISEEEALADGWAQSPAPDDIRNALDALHQAGASIVLLSRAEQPALVLDGTRQRYLQLTAPRIHAIEPHGTGDSMFAALGAGLAHGLGLEPALRMAMAAGCLNATRHGLGTGTGQEIEQLSRHVQIAELSRERTAQSGRSSSSACA